MRGDLPSSWAFLDNVASGVLLNYDCRLEALPALKRGSNKVFYGEPCRSLEDAEECADVEDETTLWTLIEVVKRRGASICRSHR